MTQKSEILLNSDEWAVHRKKTDQVILSYIFDLVLRQTHKQEQKVYINPVSLDSFSHFKNSYQVQLSCILSPIPDSQCDVY